MTLKKKGASLIVWGILGLFLILAVLPLINYFIATSDTTMLKDHGISEDDEFKPYDYNSGMSDEEKIVDTSINYLTKAIDALAKNENIPSSITQDKIQPTFTVVFDGQFEYEDGLIDKDERSYCKAEIKHEGATIINCLEYFNLHDIKYLEAKTPGDINKIFSFGIDTNNKECQSNLKYFSTELKTRGDKEDCSDAPNYILYKGYKISYCGNFGWNIKINVEKVDETTCSGDKFVKTRESEVDLLASDISKTANFLQSLFGFKPDAVSTAFCDDGQTITVGKITMCLRCDNTRNKCDLIGFELPQSIKKEEAESWIAGYGDPKYLVYYESFPQGEEVSWQISEITALSTVLAYSSVALDAIPLVGKLAKTGVFTKYLEPVVETLTKLKNNLYDSTIGSAVNGMKSNFPKLFLKDPEEILDLSLRAASKVGSTISKEYVVSIVNKNLVNEYLGNLFVGTSINIDNLADDIAKNVDFTKYLNDAEELTEEGIKKYTDEVAFYYRQSMASQKQDYVEKTSYLAEVAAKKLDPVSTADYGVLSREGFEVAESCCRGDPVRWKKAYDEYFYYKAEREFNKKIDDGVEIINNEMGKSLKGVDISSQIEHIVFQNTLNAQEQFFKAQFKTLFTKKYQGGTLRYSIDEKAFEEVLEGVSKNLEKMSPEARELLSKKAKLMSQEFMTENGLDFTKIIGKEVDKSPDSKKEFVDSIANLINGKKTNYGKTMDFISETFETVSTSKIGKTTTATVSGTYNRKETLILGGVIAIYAAKLDAENEKYVPTGYNNLALSHVTTGVKREYELSGEAKNLFIRLDKNGRDASSTSRMFFASPCKTDLDIRKQKCSCSVEEVVAKYNGEWTGYLKKTGENEYVPIRNVKASEKEYTYVTLEKKDAGKIKYEQIDGVSGVYQTIPSMQTEEFPVLEDYVDVSFAIKECNTRGWWDSQVFTFSNVDVETECVSISQSDSSDEKYNEYNDGYNFCYSGDNEVGEAIKGVITTSQVGISIAAGATTAGLGTCIASPVVNVIGNYVINNIDESSKWPNKEFKSSSLVPFSD